MPKTMKPEWYDHMMLRFLQTTAARDATMLANMIYMQRVKSIKAQQKQLDAAKANRPAA